MIIEFIILAGLIGGIVYAAMRWSDLEDRLFPGHHRAHRSDHSRTASGLHTEPTNSAPTEQTEPGGEETTPIAKGFMRKKDLSAEPEVDSDDFHKTQGASASAAEPAAASTATEPAESAATQTDQSDQSDDAPSDPNPAADYAANPTPPPAETEPTPEPAPKPVASTTPKPESPGDHVTGAPARPSQPAYVNASSGVEERVEDLAAEADAAYRDRDYEKAEQACLKILMREPKNHKYMTRIGQIYQEMGQLDDAKEAFETAKKLDPKNFFVLNRLAEVERLLNDRGGRTSENKGARSAKDSNDDRD